MTIAAETIICSLLSFGFQYVLLHFVLERITIRFTPNVVRHYIVAPGV